MKHKWIKIFAVAAIMAVIAFISYLMNMMEKTKLLSNEGRSFEKATVVEIVKDNLQEGGMRVGTQQVKVKIRTGEHKGEIMDAGSSSSYLYGAGCMVGTKVIVIISESENLQTVSVYNYDRGNLLYGIIFFFLLVLILLGGMKGFKSAVGLVFTMWCVVFMFLPMVYRGLSPILGAVLLVVITTVVVMYLIDGMSGKSVCAMAATVMGVICSALFAKLFGWMTHISGYNVDDIESLVYIGQMTQIEVGELLFAGIIISALGAVMDVAMSVASTVSEIYEKRPDMTRKELYHSGINVGKDMMGTMSNTLILAFTGSSLNTLIYIYSYQYAYYQVLNMYSIGIEIIQGVSATLGVILTVPFTAWLTSVVLTAKNETCNLS